MNNAEKLIDFLNHAHSVFHATANLEAILKEAGFKRLKENEDWKIEADSRYYVTRNDSSILAFDVPKIEDIRSLNIVAAHSDSPTFKLKPVTKLPDGNGYEKLNVEIYGGPILSTWIDRPLSVAGRAVIRKEGQLVSELVDFDEVTAIIPNVAIHQNRTLNDGYKYNPQVDLIPLVGQDITGNYLISRIASACNVEEKEVLGYDMFLYLRTPGELWGSNREFLSSQRLDDLECAFCAAEAIKQAHSANSINICAIFDNEEVGSRSRQGAAGDMLVNITDRIFETLGFSRSRIAQIIANSFLISADNAHAVHPNHPELYDTANKAKMNGGVVIKRNPSQSYVTDGLGQAIMEEICTRSEVPYQYFANRSDNRGGGTQASAMVTQMNLVAVDIGLAQLAMHSCYETGGAEDVDHLINAFKEFYCSSVLIDGNQIQIVK